MTVRLLAFAGSTRAGSLNQALLDLAVAEARRQGAEVTSIRLKDFDLPLYDGDLEASDFPAKARELKGLFRAHHGVLIASPEYNGSVSGVLKNAIDWASRPPHQPLDAKPIAIFGTSPGATGTIRGQAHLRQILGNVNGLVLVQPVVAIGMAPQRFDAEANVTDEATKTFIVNMLTKLADWTQKLKA